MNDQRNTSTLCSPRRGFTLIELMVTMSIMAILTAAMAYVMAGAQESAQIAKTRTLIARLHTLVMQKYESYRYRRLPIAMPVGLSPKQAAQVRCDAIRQLMRMEMPKRWTDIYDPPTAINNPAGGPGIPMQRPSVTVAYKAFYDSLNPASFNGTRFQGAKCLYLLITRGLDESDVMENFSEGDIADVDQSGCKVFMDAWGNPIHFLRWAPGFISPLQPDAPAAAGQRDLRMPDQTDPTGGYGSPKPGSVLVTGAGGGRVPRNTFALYPLIYSDGPDGYDDLISESTPNPPFHYGIPDSNHPIANDPFASVSDTTDFPDAPIGGPASPTTLGRSLGVSDNIHNHTIGAR